MGEKTSGDNQKNDSKKDGDTEELKKKLAKCEKQRDEYLAGWQRAKADFINYKKEELQRLEELAKYGNEVLIKDLLVILDNFDLAITAMEKAGTAEKGIYMIRSQFMEFLKKRGVEQIKVNIGDPFDPSVAEAIVHLESDEPSGSVLEEIEPGYRLHDKILRPAKVKVAKSSTKN